MPSATRIFGSVDLAARIEAAEVELLEACAQAAEHRGATGVLRRRVAGGSATWTEAGSPLAKFAGLGFGGVPDDADLDEIERLFRARATPVQVEISTLADPQVASRLSERGYHLVGFENVLARALGTADVVPSSDLIEVRPSPVEEFPLWLDLAVTGFATPDDRGVVSHESFPREALERTMTDMATAGGFRRYVARRGGSPAGAASLRVSCGGVAQLCGAATLPEFRRRGVQAALLQARLADAAAAGCTLAVVTTQPGSTSQANVERQGFQLVYARAVLVRG